MVGDHAILRNSCVGTQGEGEHYHLDTAVCEEDLYAETEFRK